MKLKELQKEILQNKIDKGFNITDIYKEFCFLYGEVGEALEAYFKKQDDIGEELADVVIFTLGISEILGIDLQKEIEKKVAKNRKRKYKTVNGVKIKIEEV